MANKVLLIGLGQAGVSIGLALARAEGEVGRIGCDPDKKTANEAKASGAVDRLVSHPRLAVESADLIIFDLPYQEVEEYLKYFGTKMQADAIIIDTAPIKAPFFKWAAQYLPAGCACVGATPIVGDLDIEEPRPDGVVDRFAGGLVAITAPPKTPERAIALAIKLAKILEAEPFFLDIDEQDSAAAAVEDLPALMSITMFQSTANSASWRELQRIAGTLFMESTELCNTDPTMLRKRIEGNREAILARLDAFAIEVSRLRNLLSNKQDKDLEHYLKQADSTRSSWLRARAHGDWASQEALTPTSIGT
ncbi:MAG TPA: prephenate dehydrogenase, partial [Anaerolineales bacterium]|nr:prephenate dehydrogenase [Anaerolineales bacterium]